MYQPYTDELFAGDCEQAFFERGDLHRALRSHDGAEVGEAVLATTGIDWFAKEEVEMISRLREAVKLFRVGGDCYIFALTAMGHVQLASDGALNTYSDH